MRILFRIFISILIIPIGYVSILLWSAHHRHDRSIWTLFELIRSYSWIKTFQTRPHISQTLIAHGGGKVEGLTYTNCLEALDSNYAKGHRIFEMDFERSSDGAVVLLHDWDCSWSSLRPSDTARGRRTLRQFLATPMIHNSHPLDWAGLAAWMRRHPDAYINTDVKDDNVAVLRELAKQTDLVPRIIPQLQHFPEYTPVRKMGYRIMFLTLYKAPQYPNWAIRWFCKCKPVAAIVCWPWRARHNGLAMQLRSDGVPVFVHTVNNPDSLKALQKIGAYGVLTDELTPK